MSILIFHANEALLNLNESNWESLPSLMTLTHSSFTSCEQNLRPKFAPLSPGLDGGTLHVIIIIFSFYMDYASDSAWRLASALVNGTPAAGGTMGLRDNGTPQN